MATDPSSRSRPSARAARCRRGAVKFITFNRDGVKRQNRPADPGSHYITRRQAEDTSSRRRHRVALATCW